MPTYRIDLVYDGSGFHGYAKQNAVRTVQGDLEAALEPFVPGVETVVAGRTDKGVHASGQVVSFRTVESIDIARVTRSLNRQLGPEVAVAGLREVADDFHARFSATGRRYVYRILNQPVHDPFERTKSWHVTDVLDVDRMNAGASHLVGEHDFASFCRKAQDRSTVRLVRTAVWHDDGSGMLRFEVEASSFCHQMVRSLVAVLVDVGRGRLDVADVQRIVSARDRTAGRGVAPPHGLTLVEVSYSPD